MIRLSLSVLNRLLLLRNNTFLGSKTDSSPLVSVLFSTPGQTNQPQIVLMVAHYAFQRYNPLLATLAIQLLKRFAKEFPMSLLGCFASEAEAIRDHFLSRLNSPYEDIRLKVSILEFLTVCVAQQPGLIEMFINVTKKEDKDLRIEGSKSCLDCVKNILKSKMSETEDIYPNELLCAAVEFIHALWAGHQALATEALKEDLAFWNMTCHTVLNSKLLQDTAAIGAYIIRILALEIFYNEKDKLDPQIKNVLKEIEEKNYLLKWSEHIHGPHTSNAPNENSLHLDSSSTNIQDSFALLTAWRDFLLVLTVYEPLKMTADLKKKILRNILAHFTDEINANNSRVLTLLSELFLMLSRHWQGEFIAFIEEEEENCSIFRILSEAADNSDTIHLREQLVVISLAIYTVRVFSKSNKKIKGLNEWIVPCCQLLKKAYYLIHQSIDPKYVEGVLKLPIVTITLLNELVQEVKDFLPVLKNQTVIPLLVGLLINSLKFNIGLELSHSILLLFLSMASDKKAAEALCNTGFMSELTLILSNINLEENLKERRRCLGSQKQKRSKIDVYFAFLRFITTLLQSVGSYFLHDCWDFIGIHQEFLHLSLVNIKESFFVEEIREAIFTCNFILQLSSHQVEWKLEHPKSLQRLLVAVCNCIYQTIAVLNKPEFLKFIVMKRHPNINSKSVKVSEVETSLKRNLSEDDSQTPLEVLEIQEKLYELLGIAITVLVKFCPEMHETLSGNVYDYGQFQLLLNINFSVPSLERDGPFGFGSLLACITMCLKQLLKNEKTPSPRKVTDIAPQISKSLIVYIVEVTLSILLSQANVAMIHPDLHLRDKQMVKRELAPELTSINGTITRFLRRGGPPSPIGAVTFLSPMKAQSHAEFPYLKMISNLIDKLYK